MKAVNDGNTVPTQQNHNPDKADRNNSPPPFRTVQMAAKKEKRNLALVKHKTAALQIFFRTLSWYNPARKVQAHQPVFFVLRGFLLGFGATSSAGFDAASFVPAADGATESG